MKKLKLPVRSWVPQSLSLFTLFMLLLSVVLVNGAYLGSSIDVSGSLGTTSEDIMMAYYACSVGMVVANPLVQKIRQVLTSKTLILADMALQALLSLICAQSEYMEITIFCCFLIGVLKTFLLLEFIILLTPLFSPGNVRSEYYSWFYPIVFGGGQVSVPLTAWLAYNYQWQYTYYFVIVLLLFTMTLVLLFFRNAKKPELVPLKEINYRSIFLISIAYLMIVYVFIYGKMLDWFGSDIICMFSVIGGILLVLFFVHQHSAHKPYISLRPLKHTKSVIGYLFMFLCIFFNSDTSLINSYVNNILNLDSVHANILVLWTIPGYIIAGIIGFWWFRLQRWRFRYLISASLFLYAIYFAFIYWGISPEARYESLFFPMIFKGVGMMLLIIAFGVYTAEDLESPYLVSNTFFMISTRSALAPVISSSFFANWLYKLQIENMNRLSGHITFTFADASRRYAQFFQDAVSKGLGYDNSILLANNNLYNILYTQGLLLSIKIIFGYLLLTAIILAFLSSLLPFHKAIKVPIVKAGTDMA